MNKSPAKDFLPRIQVARAVLMAGALLMVGLAQSARATPITYTYTGNTFHYIGGCCGVSNVSGSFTLAALLAPSTTQTLEPDTAGGTVLDFTFTDGRTVWDTGNYIMNNGLYELAATQFTVTTNAAGAIVSWFVNINASFGYVDTCFGVSGPPDAGCPSDSTNVFYNYDAYTLSEYYEPGTWTRTGSPEPTSFLLLVTGLLGLATIVLRRRQVSSKTLRN